MVKPVSRTMTKATVGAGHRHAQPAHQGTCVVDGVCEGTPPLPFPGPRSADLHRREHALDRIRCPQMIPMRSPPIRYCGARLAFVPEGTQSVSVATAKADVPGVSVTWSSRLAAR